MYNEKETLDKSTLRHLHKCHQLAFYYQNMTSGMFIFVTVWLMNFQMTTVLYISDATLALTTTELGTNT